MKQQRNVGWLVLCGMIGIGLWSPSSQATVHWTNSVSGDWSVGGNWDNGGLPPGAGDDVVIGLTNASVILSGSTTINSLIISNASGKTGTLTFTNWSTALTVNGNASILTNGVVTLPGAFTNTAMSNRVYIICSNLTVDTGGKINANGKGFAGGATNSMGNGPGGGTNNIVNSAGTGGGYGGYGGDAGPGHNNVTYGKTYGSATAPVDPGSGGAGTAYNPGGSGGGAIRISASGAVVLSGVITANGMPGTHASEGSGSGGGIYITCLTFNGTNGTVSADGGGVAPFGSQSGGGGGRISIGYNPTAQSTQPIPSVQFTALGKNGSSPYSRYSQGDVGTLYFPDTFLLKQVMTYNGQLVGVSSWSTTNLTVSNAWVRFPADGFQLIVLSNLTIFGGSTTSRFEVGSNPYEHFNINTAAPMVTVGGNLILTNGALSNAGAIFGLFSGQGITTNAALTNCGALLTVGQDIRIGSNCWIYPASHPTNGGSVLFRAANIAIANGGGVSADYLGFGGGYGTGAGKSTGSGYESGGGYGGRGGDGQWMVGSGGITYGSSNAPVDPGSGSMISYHGGGLIRIEASQAFILDGTLTANGEDSTFHYVNGGGSGGGIYVQCRQFRGASTGIVKANGGSCGGNNYTGAGGGGRIAIWRKIPDAYAGAYPVVTNGTWTTNGWNSPNYVGATTGTVFFGWTHLPAGAILTIY